MVTGRISLLSPEYSPISSSVSDVRAISSRFHCRPATVFVTRIRVVAFAFAIAAAPTSVLPGAAGQHHDAGAAGPEAFDGLLLVVAQVPVALVEVDGVRLAVDVAGEVLGGPADLEQRLLEPAALGGVDRDGVVVDAGRRASGRSSCSAGPPRAPRGRRRQHQPVGRVAWPAAGGRSGPSCRRRRPAARAAPRSGSTDERVDDLLGVVAGRAGVPEPERGDPVGVDVLRGALELGEGRDRRARRAGVLVVDLEEQGLVGLDDQRSGPGGAHASGPPLDGAGDAAAIRRRVPLSSPARTITRGAPPRGLTSHVP